MYWKVVLALALGMGIGIAVYWGGETKARAALETDRAKPTEYIVLKSLGPDFLAKDVNKKMAEGYEPVGGVAAVQTPPTFQYLQAMIKR